MTSTNSNPSQPRPAVISTSQSQMAPTIPPLPTTLPEKIDLFISLLLHTWPALTLATTSQFGGPSSSDKRDWFAGAISDMFPPATATTTNSTNNASTSGTGAIRDVEDLEDVLEQIMGDEFETVVEDGSLEEIAGKIWEGRLVLMRGEERGLEGLWRRWWVQEQKRRERGFVGSAGGNVNVMFKRGGDPDQEESSGDDEEGDSDEDEEMQDADASELVETNGSRQKQKREPEIDEDGFTKVVGRKGKR